MGLVMENLTVSTVPPTAVSSTQASPPRNAASSQPSETKVFKPAEFFSSPKGKIDSDGFYVVQFRDPESGEVQLEYPSKKVTTAYKQTVSSTQSAAPQPSSGSGGGTPRAAAPESEAPQPAPAPSKAPEAKVSSVSEEA